MRILVPIVLLLMVGMLAVGLWPAAEPSPTLTIDDSGVADFTVYEPSYPETPSEPPFNVEGYTTYSGLPSLVWHGSDNLVFNGGGGEMCRITPRPDGTFEFKGDIDACAKSIYEAIVRKSP